MNGKLPGRVSIEENVVFGTGGGRDLHCDVFTPPDTRTDRTAVLLIHGGGWQNGSRAQLRGYGVQLARYGYLCVCPEYRLSGESTWPAQIHDVKAALRWLRANAADTGCRCRENRRLRQFGRRASCADAGGNTERTRVRRQGRKCRHARRTAPRSSPSIRPRHCASARSATPWRICSAARQAARRKTRQARSRTCTGTFRRRC